MITVRVPPDLVAKADERAAELGLDRGKYLRNLIEQDIATARPRKSKRRFASEDFIGSVALDQGPYDDRRVRALVRDRLRAKREANR